MRKSLLVISVVLMSMGQMCGPTLPTDNLGDEELIYTNTNNATVTNGPTAATSFTTTNKYTLTRIKTYHWNGGDGTPAAGTIGLTSGGSETYGPFAATGIDGQSSTPNAYWEAAISGVTIDPGTYTVTDSDNATWSCNSASGNAGHVWVYGRKHNDTASDEPDLLAIAKNASHVYISLVGKHTYGGVGGGTGETNSLFFSLIAFNNVYTEYHGFHNVRAPITWNGNTFTATYSGSTNDGDSDQTLNFEITGTLAADGRSISAWEASHVLVDSGLLGSFTTSSYLKSSSLPLPYYRTVGSGRVDYEVSGSTVGQYIESQTIEDTNEFLMYSYTSTDYSSNDPQSRLGVLFDTN